MIYRHLECPEIYDGMAALIEKTEAGTIGEEDRELLYGTVSALVELAASHGFGGNIWQCYLAYEIAQNENALSRACEVRGMGEGSMNRLAGHDFGILKKLLDYPLEKIGRALDGAVSGSLVPGDKLAGNGMSVDGISHGSVMDIIKNYVCANENSHVFNVRIRDRIQKLGRELAKAADAGEYLEVVAGFYRECGVGKLGLHKAFRIQGEGAGAEIEPITKIQHVYFRDLVGYERQKKKLMENTEAFLEGRGANNCLLYGDSGTGKSSSIKALMNEYYGRGLRLIEVYKHQFKELPYVIAQIKNRNYKFILLMDDLSFEDFEIEYKYLKAIIEGGLETRPDNVLIYATSNRRHLIREKYSDKRERQDDLHGNDTVQEKLSLVARFGVQIYYGAPDRKEYEGIVKSLAERAGLTMPEEELLTEANAWELNHGGRSGRTAAQFITYLKGRGTAKP